MLRSLDLLFQDMEERIKRLHQTVLDERRDTFLESRKAQDGAERNLQIIGEALSQALQQDPSLTWKITETQKIIALRHLLTHHYYKVSPEMIWDILIRNLPLLTLQVADQRKRWSPEGQTK